MLEKNPGTIFICKLQHILHLSSYVYCIVGCKRESVMTMDLPKTLFRVQEIWVARGEISFWYPDVSQPPLAAKKMPLDKSWLWFS